MTRRKGKVPGWRKRKTKHFLGLRSLLTETEVSFRSGQPGGEKPAEPPGRPPVGEGPTSTEESTAGGPAATTPQSWSEWKKTLLEEEERTATSPASDKRETSNSAG